MNEKTLSYLHPKAKIELGLELVGIASSAIDISDGLLQDVNLICKSSGIGAEIFLDKIPTFSSEKSLELINSGDDYELCFTASEQFINETDVPIQRIGTVRNDLGLNCTLDGNSYEFRNKGYRHFT